MTGRPESRAWARACWDGEESQQPLCPHWAHRRRCNHQPPGFSHSTQPGPDGGTRGAMPGVAVTGSVHQPDGVRRKSPAGGARLPSVAPRRLLLVRHAQAANAPLDRDRPLTEHGTEQARAIGSWLAERALVPARAHVTSARLTGLSWAPASLRRSKAALPSLDEQNNNNTVDAALAAIQETPHEVRV